MKQTLHYHSHEMNTLKKSIDILEDFFMKDAVEIDPHLLNISDGKYVSKRKLNEEERHALELANGENTLLEMIINLWFELGEAIRNLIIGNYGSVYRSLRWILESAVFWTYLQIDKEQNAKEPQLDLTKDPFSLSFSQSFEYYLIKIRFLLAIFSIIILGQLNHPITIITI